VRSDASNTNDLPGHDGPGERRVRPGD